MKKFNAVLLSGVLTVSTVVLAESQVNQENSQTVNTSLQALEQRQMAKSAQEWGLTAEEWQRYETLKKGRRGVLSPGLDPLTMLGIEARSDEERRHFAELAVKQEFQRVEAELSFQREVNSAWVRVYPGVLPVQALRSEVSNARQALFVKDNCPACDRKLTQLMKSNQPLDIYLVDSGGKDEAVRNWAKKHNIPAEKVKSRQITLNHDSGMWLKYGNGMMPVVLQQGAQGWQRVN
ncbi:TIGR03759 family integrating conjugative element protein [Salmonella enterica subsp. houtenae serovar 44:z36,[z38]:-]|uniref:TIGR03759 family integrating conjugative element protein n=1 Tax=Salmonella enterica subsp. houtenae serovar 44:z36[z38]:- TaxID=1967609 RepID=A0A736I1P3_SALHO|nr:TIGR03759 family integrating conjugative element protein [Salmonella enterica]EHM8757103.1 TIGR03759 family integrating conjugative element protein [Salmonella enterica subsp. houtenae serovar 44:z36,[z38]:-]HAE7580896.1 TIGR03759 family integrating conjugative element protein [Salmonella enterica subsp. houtenae serovar 44:z36[z38]:-]HCM6266690.1 TIGR03759 family integrating conjugative element protein [Salmonella enterica subsp. houtenae serovar 44:z36,Z38:-]EGF3877519.1 TIGR03759 family i